MKTIKIIPTEAYPNQTLSFVLANDRTTVTLHTRLGQLFATVETEKHGVLIRNRVCLDRTPITDNLFFFDADGTENPTYTGLNSRFFLVWHDES